MPPSSPAPPDETFAEIPPHDTRQRPLPGQAVAQVVPRLQTAYQQDAPWAVSAVARLRREVGRAVHESPPSWGLEHLEALAELQEQRRAAERESRGAGTADRADLTAVGWKARERRERREESAVHLAVTLWALHQQSLRDEAMHRPGWTLGRAVRRLAHERAGARGVTAAVPAEDNGAKAAPQGRGGPPVEEASETVRRRFVRAGSASDIEMLSTRLRELVVLFRSSRIPLDYALLADQLLRWQDENQRDIVRRTWGRDFHRHHRTSSDDGAEAARDASAEGPEPAATEPPPEELDADF